MTPIEISVVVITIAFVILVIYLVIVLIKASKILSQVDTQLHGLGDEPKRLLNNINQITESTSEKMKSLDPLFRGLSNVSEGLEFKSRAFKERLVLSSLKDKLNGDAYEGLNVSDIVNTLSSVATIWTKLKK